MHYGIICFNLWAENLLIGEVPMTSLFVRPKSGLIYQLTKIQDTTREENAVDIGFDEWPILTRRK